MPPLHFHLDAALALDAADPELGPDADLARARRLLRSYAPADAEQARARDRVLEFIAHHPTDAHRRQLSVGHLTASALLVDARAERALLTHHKKLGRWLQLGGHCDGDANLAAVALRECHEESGIAGLRVLPIPIDLDIHRIPARPGEPEHDHLDVRFVVLAPPGARERVSSESLELAWVAPADLPRIVSDDSVVRLFRKVFR